jgi:DNA polymerase III alpha subunit
LLSGGRTLAPKGECRISRTDLIGAAMGSVVAVMAPSVVCAEFAGRLRADAAALDHRLPLPLHCAVAGVVDGGDQCRLDRAASAGLPLLATTAPRYHEAGRRRMADVLTAIRLRTTVDRIGIAAEPNGDRRLKSPEDMAIMFQRYPGALAASMQILDATRGFSLDQLRYEYPEEVLEPGRTAQETLIARVAEAVAERWPHRVAADIMARLTAKGVIFVTIEDEHGHANVVVYAHVSERDRVPLLTSRLLVVEGRVEREDEHAEVPIVHLIAARLIDRSELLEVLPAIDEAVTAGTAAQPAGSPRIMMPPTRDFR